LKVGGAEATTDPLKGLVRLQRFESTAEELGAKFGVKQLDLGFDAVAIVGAVAEHGDAPLRNSL
jgi:hypothetical protein